MEATFNKAVEIFSTNDEIHKFFHKHCSDVHRAVDCQNSDCDIEKFLKPLK